MRWMRMTYAVGYVPRGALQQLPVVALLLIVDAVLADLSLGELVAEDPTGNCQCMVKHERDEVMLTDQQSRCRS